MQLILQVVSTSTDSMRDLKSLRGSCFFSNDIPLILCYASRLHLLGVGCTLFVPLPVEYIDEVEQMDASVSQMLENFGGG